MTILFVLIALCVWLLLGAWCDRDMKNLPLRWTLRRE